MQTIDVQSFSSINHVLREIMKDLRNTLLIEDAPVARNLISKSYEDVEQATFLIHRAKILYSLSQIKE